MRYDDRITSVESDDRVIFEEQEHFSSLSADVEECPADIFEYDEVDPFLLREDWRFKGLWEEPFDERDSL